MSRLYRGVSKCLDLVCCGELRPKGNKHEVVARHDGKIMHDGKFTYGISESNAVRAHQIESGLYSVCYVSTTRDEHMAHIFATNNHTEEGWVYIIDESSFEQYGVIAREFSDPQYPNEKEISIRAADNKSIPHQVIIEKYEVDATGRKKT
jgi:hypothetical protein